uniref:Uncharacterized protein n=1 Tax=Arundo donax TaxID=35708 RepID=A0A0A9HR32_ARUDO
MAPWSWTAQMMVFWKCHIIVEDWWRKRLLLNRHLLRN